MGLPDMSYMMKVGQLRHIQATYEEVARRNPDVLVKHLLTIGERIECALRGVFALRRMRTNPFYPYILSRTLYYDEIYRKAIKSNARFIINVGCGGDTRAYRWKDELISRSIETIECDQPAASRAKQELARRKLSAQHVKYMEIDLNLGHWSSLETWLSQHRSDAGLVMFEGVSPYIENVRFQEFLSMLVRVLNCKSQIAYDYKVSGVKDKFGGNGSSFELFRLPRERSIADAFHSKLGLQLIHFETSLDLTQRLPTKAIVGNFDAFNEDVLLQLAPIPQQILG